MAKSIMFQGTGSHVGKSILATALCRIFKQDGYSVAPFKAQNMALNSFVTKSGGEMGRAQVAQAEACEIEPEVEMNPILLKPTGNSSSQVIVLGKPVGNLSAREYHQNYNITALDIVIESYNKLADKYQVMVLEGAGSPAEVNLKSRDIVNMRMAKIADAPVILVADIDRGGAIASIVGTLELLDQDERELIKGIIINKFRGDVKLLEPALDFIEEKTGKPVLGVIPHLPDIGIADEDSVSREGDNPLKDCSAEFLDIVVVSLPRLSNFTDFDCFNTEPDVKVRYVKNVQDLDQPDLIIIPGSKNTIEDMLFLEQTKLADGIKFLANKGVPVIGICGGYQILGEHLEDPAGTESSVSYTKGLELLPIKTVFAREKNTCQVQGTVCNINSPLLANCGNIEIIGYEIHMGVSQLLAGADRVVQIRRISDQDNWYNDGAVSRTGLIFGTYVHGIFDNDEFRRQLLNNIRILKDWQPLSYQNVSFARKKADSYDRLANHVRAHLDMGKVYEIVGLSR
ncbi:MAG: cobyric acid synthase [Clostridia bacterium]|jgi:adenosylcobyric acid synthase|nr:cobyric acid synthase [Clostridia bacterium]